MSWLPHVDPIPLPAPVWLFKALEVLTVGLHFLAVQLLIGSLAVAALWAIVGRRRQDTVLIDASGAIAARLPILMTYVINLGVPPLLFAQVLYGRALYTSSVLIGGFWILVILLLMMSYMCLYHMSSRANRGKAWGWLGLIALVITLKIAVIYTSNMTLMLRPNVWREMYRHDALGWHLNSGDPTVLPRWLFMMFGGLTVGGVGLMFLGLVSRLADEAATLMRRWGARLAGAGAVVQTGLAIWVLGAQPEAVGQWLSEGVRSVVYGSCLAVWAACAALVLLVGAVAQARASARLWRWPTAAGLIVFVQMLAMTIYRGGLRDGALAAYGFDVWDRQVADHWVAWVVVGAFLVLFVAGLAVVGWLVGVALRCEKVEESYA